MKVFYIGYDAGPDTNGHIRPLVLRHKKYCQQVLECYAGCFAGPDLTFYPASEQVRASGAAPAYALGPAFGGQGSEAVGARGPGGG